MHGFQINAELQGKLKKLAKKNSVLHGQILDKINEVINSYDIEHYKNLKYGMKDSKRVHIGYFVIIFQYDKKNDMINFDDFDHHDKIYDR